MTATLFNQIDSATDELEDSFWSLLHGVAADAETSPVDVLSLFKRTAIERLRSLKPTHGIDRTDDGRAAFWRFRAQIIGVRAEGESILADTDPGKRFDTLVVEPGSAILAGLPNVAREVLAMARDYHAANDAGWAVDGLSEPILLSKLRSLRVALSTQHGACVWRIRYLLQPPTSGVAPAQPVAGSLRGVQRRGEARQLRIEVHVSREMAAQRTMRSA